MTTIHHHLGMTVVLLLLLLLPTGAAAIPVVAIHTETLLLLLLLFECIVHVSQQCVQQSAHAEAQHCVAVIVYKRWTYECTDLLCRLCTSTERSSWIVSTVASLK